MFEGLIASIENTPYLALVEHIDVKVIQRLDIDTTDDYSEETQVYTVKVLKTFRGEKLSNLEYRMIVETGESVNLPKEPVIIALCKNEEGFYWPGVGSQFPLDDQTEKTIEETLGSINKAQKDFEFCEN